MKKLLSNMYRIAEFLLLSIKPKVSQMFTPDFYSKKVILFCGDLKI